MRINLDGTVFSHRKIRPAEPQRFSRHSSATNKKGRSIWNVLFCWWSSPIKIRIPCRRALVKRDRPRSMRIIVGQDRFILEHDEVEGATSFALSSTTTGTTPAADRRPISHIIYGTLYRGKIMPAQRRAVPSSCAWTYVRCTGAHTDPTRPARSCSGVQSSCE